MRSLLRVSVLVVALAVPVAAWALGPARVKPLGEADVLKLIELQIDDDAIVARVERGGLGFKADEAALGRVRGAGASEDVLSALRRLGGEKGASDLPDDPARASIMVWVDPYYNWTCPLECEMRVNGHLVNRFSSKAQQSIGKHVKMGWNT